MNPETPSVDRNGSLPHEGLERTFLVHLPKNYGRQKLMPLVVVLHGALGSASRIRNMSKMNERADRDGVIVVYPEGTSDDPWSGEFTWNGGNCCGDAMHNQIDDVGFIRKLIEELKKEYPIDSSRIYAAGFSNGGIMAYRLACELSEIFRAIAVVSGALGVEKCQPSRPVSVIAFHGTLDSKVLYNGGVSAEEVEKNYDQPVSYAIDFCVRHNQCATVPREERRGNVIRKIYSGGKSGTEVVLYSILDGEHEWPGMRGGKRFEQLSQPEDEISATDEIWDFFLKH